MYDDVLVATDGSDRADAAVDEAIDLAALTDATLHVLSVAEGTDVPVPEAELVALEEAMDTVASTAIDDVRQQANTSGVGTETAVREGAPAEEVLAYAQKYDVDIVVMGTDGRSGLDRVLLGSVAETVLRSAERPVLVQGGET